MKSKRANISTYFFLGRLSDSLADFQVQNLPITGTFIFELFGSGISIWGSSKKPFDFVRSIITEMCESIVAGYCLQTNHRLTYHFDQWVETKEVKATKNIIGWFIPAFTKIKVRTVRSKANTPWKKAVSLYRLLLNNDANYRLALKDFHFALTNTSDDAFFYAYRAIEDVCRAVSGLFDTDSNSWKIMHNTLGTTEESIEPLKKIADEIRHGKNNTRIIKNARKIRDKKIEIARQIVIKSIRKIDANCL